MFSQSPLCWSKQLATQHTFQGVFLYLLCATAGGYLYLICVEASSCVIPAHISRYLLWVEASRQWPQELLNYRVFSLSESDPRLSSISTLCWAGDPSTHFRVFSLSPFQGVFSISISECFGLKVISASWRGVSFYIYSVPNNEPSQFPLQDVCLYLLCARSKQLAIPVQISVYLCWNKQLVISQNVSSIPPVLHLGLWRAHPGLQVMDSMFPKNKRVPYTTC